jgi:LCP family protein required for cell wall assembly
MPDPSRASEPPPSYTKYRARPRLFERGGDGSVRSGRDSGDGGRGGGGGGRRRFFRRSGRPLSVGRVVRWVLLAIVAWLLLSFVVFLVSAQIERGNLSSSAKAALTSGGTPPFSATNVLVLGSDQRPAGTHEGGASTTGPSRSDVILLMRLGGGHQSRLSIPRDTVVNIPGHGTSKINAAFAYGGPSLAIRTVEALTGIQINHLVEVSFTNFPKLIDAMGGIDYTGGCVYSKINGGYKNGGVTLHLKKGTHHLNGKQALALARTRHNSCKPSENDLTRARRQQKIFSAMKHQLLSPTTFVRLPWVSWAAPKAIVTDMGGPTLAGVFGSLALSGSPATHVLIPDGVRTLPDGEVGLSVSSAEIRREVNTFLGR